MIEELRHETPLQILQIVDLVWENKNDFVKWPQVSLLFMPDTIRVDYHKYSPEQKERLRKASIPLDARSNGPAVMAFLLAGGERPDRIKPNSKWSIHHIYDGKFPATGCSNTIHAIKDGRYFTQAAGLVAIHPIADALADEIPYFAWLLRREAFDRFEFDPDNVFH